MRFYLKQGSKPLIVAKRIKEYMCVAAKCISQVVSLVFVILVGRDGEIMKFLLIFI